MAALVRIARRTELPEGGKLVKETHGRKVLLTRMNGTVFATDAHCFHMGGNLWEGDIEDVGGHACVICPLHRYKIDMSTGQKVDTQLDGCVVCSPSQQQRTYKVYDDGEFIRIDIPELHQQLPLPSDRYNQVAAAAAPRRAAGYGLAGASTGASLQGTPGRGLFGSSTSGTPGRGLVAPEPLAPFAGFHSRGLAAGPGTPSKEAADEPALVLSQEEPQQPQQMQQPVQQQPVQQAPTYTQGHIPFTQSRVDTARIARRKAATAAIAARSYAPPSAPPLQAQKQQQQGLARQSSGQQSLLSFGFTVQQQQQQQRSPAVTTGPEDMDMS